MKTTGLFIFMILALSGWAQDYSLTFAGSGASTSVDYVLVQNLTQGTDVTVDGSDTLFLVANMGVPSQSNLKKGLKIYPNPIHQDAKVELFQPEEGAIKVSVLNSEGRSIVYYSGQISAGAHLIIIRRLPAGLYFIHVHKTDGIFTSKLISCNTSIGIPVIQYEGAVASPEEGNEYKSISNQVKMQYNSGDRLLLKGHSETFATILTIVPSSNQEINFEFVPCSDVDGNNYAVSRIGSQVWMAENLRTSRLNDLTVLPIDSSITAWAGGHPGYCWYNNDSASNEHVYGKLYNFATVATGLLCPAGWHVPSDTAWDVLSTFLGSDTLAGAKMRETGYSHWMEPNSGATNEVGFTALPGGSRNNVGSFGGIQTFGGWWSGTSISTLDKAWSRQIDFDKPNLVSNQSFIERGFSIRCLKD